MISFFRFGHILTLLVLHKRFITYHRLIFSVIYFIVTEKYPMTRIKATSIAFNFKKKIDVKNDRKFVVIDEKKKRRYKLNSKYYYHVILSH